MARLLSLRPHTTHDAKGAVVEHPEGATYELDDAQVIETLLALGFARLDKRGPVEVPIAVQSDDAHTDTTTGLEPAPPPPIRQPPSKSTRRK